MRSSMHLWVADSVPCFIKTCKYIEIEMSNIFAYFTNRMPTNLAYEYWFKRLYHNYLHDSALLLFKVLKQLQNLTALQM